MNSLVQNSPKVNPPPAWEVASDLEFGGYIGFLDGREVAYGATRSKCYQNLIDALVIRRKHAALNPAEAVNWDSAPVGEVA